MLNNEELENWPFLDSDSGKEIHKDMYYGFYDSGGFIGPYKVKIEFILDLLETFDITKKDVSMLPEDLGGVLCCLLTGRQYIDQLYVINGGDDIFDHGSWTTT